MGVLILTDFEVWVVLGVPVGGIGRDTVAQLQPRGKGVEPLPIVIIVVVVISVSRVVGLLIVYSMKYKYIYGTSAVRLLYRTAVYSASIS